MIGVDARGIYHRVLSGNGCTAYFLCGEAGEQVEGGVVTCLECMSGESTIHEAIHKKLAGYIGSPVSKDTVREIELALEAKLTSLKVVL